MRIVNTCNYCSEYPEEYFYPGVFLTEERAHLVCEGLNEQIAAPYSSRLWKVVPNNYVLQTGFKP